MDNTDYYALLGVDPSSSPDEIVRAYRQLARQYHPDLNPQIADADQRIKEINEAYQVLSDPERRQQYDLQRTNSQYARTSQPSRAGASQTAQRGDGRFVHEVNIDLGGEDLGDLLQKVANGFADELREALREFRGDLDSISRSYHSPPPGPGGHQRFPPPPPRSRPPRKGRPPHGGKPPRP